MASIGNTAIGAWSGGRVLPHFGIPLDDTRLEALLRPGPDICTVITGDVYGEGSVDLTVGRALAGLPRDDFVLVSAIGHDFVQGARQGSGGYPRFTDPSLRGPQAYRDYLYQALESSLERLKQDRLDLMLLHNPDRIGYTSEVVWRAMTDLRDEGLTSMLGIAPGPANGFSLDIIGCVERFGTEIDWAMIILNPFEPWPGSYVLPACQQHDVKVLARVVDHGGIFHGDLPDEDDLLETDHRRYRPPGWVENGRARLSGLQPIADRHGLTLLQLACQWTLAQQAVCSVVPTFIQENGDRKTVEEQRAELAAVPDEILLTPDEIAEMTRLGDNTGSIPLKGGSPAHVGEQRPDSWPMAPDLDDVATRWGIKPERDLVQRA